MIKKFKSKTYKSKEIVTRQSLNWNVRKIIPLLTVEDLSSH